MSNSLRCVQIHVHVYVYDYNHIHVSVYFYIDLVNFSVWEFWTISK